MPEDCPVYLKNNFGLKSVESQKITSTFEKKFEGSPSYYIYNFEPKGFVIISAEDSYNAILAFSDESNIDFDNKETTDVLLSHLSRHEQKIAFNRKHKIEAKSKDKDGNTIKDVNFFTIFNAKSKKVASHEDFFVKRLNPWENEPGDVAKFLVGSSFKKYTFLFEKEIPTETQGKNKIVELKQDE